jgi:hypothetical protein
VSEGTRHRRRRRSTRRRQIFLAGALVVTVGAVAGWFALDRYLPAFEQARSLEADVVALASRVQSAGLDVDRSLLDDLEHDVSTARDRMKRLGALLESDPLIGIARVLPPTAADIRGADSILAAGRELFIAADHGLSIGHRFVEIKERSSGVAGEGSSMSSLVELMATSRTAALETQAALSRASAAIEVIPDGLIGPVDSARSAIAQRLATYLPLLDAYVTASDRLPSMLGWEAPRRYLVLTQNPAELRPTGGYIGSYGIVVFERGRLAEHEFRDIFLLDRPQGNPYVEPPRELADYLLGPGQGWQLADANWSPDFPTSAQDALRLYTSESGDQNIDGVLGITTHTIDDLLQVTGPVIVPEYDATISAGETTLKTLQLTRIAAPGENRKAFLSAFADVLFARLTVLPPEKWAEMLGQVDRFRSERLLLAWFKDPSDQAMAVRTGFDGAVRQDAGDYVYPVDSNVTPASKINAIATRTLRLDVALDDVGNAVNTLEVTWENPIETEVGRPYRELPTLEDLRILGMYFRLLAPVRSRIESVSGGTFDELSGPAVVEQEAGRAVIGTYLMIPPGVGGLRYVWTSPYVVTTEEAASRYRLTIQKQPGLRPGPLTVNVRLPTGGRILSTSADMSIRGGTATLTTTFDRDIDLDVRFE